MVSGKVSVDKLSGELLISSPDVVAPLADLEKVGALMVMIMACSERKHEENFAFLGG